MHLLSWGYTLLASSAAVYAWVIDIAMFSSPREHMAPDFILLMVASPLALTLDPLYTLMPSFFDLPFAQLVYITLCAALQAAFLLWFFRKESVIRA
jgi:hypothetical protein